MSDQRASVRERYARAAALRGGRRSETGSCCGRDAAFGWARYGEADLAGLPDEAVLKSLGCGNPTAVAEIRDGETVLDLGSGGGIDVLISARRVGPGGKVYGLDMTEEMLALALENKAKAGAENVEFLTGYIEEIPLPASTIDVIISNCVVNLSADKSRVFDEMFRVLRPGGRIGISDVVAADDLTEAQRRERGSYVGCIAGALSFEEYQDGLGAAGFANVSVVATHEVADRVFGAIIKAEKPAAP